MLLLNTMMIAKPSRPPRSDNRVQELLDVAARLFAKQGYAGTSMRDIAVGVNMLPGSVYYHFASKEELLVAVYGAGVNHLERVTRAAVEKEIEPWARLEALCRAHLEVVLKESDYAQVLIRVVPDDIPAAAELLRELRGRYEGMFRDVVSDLPLPTRTDRRALRLMLIGTLNWSLLWFDPQGRDSPRVLARKFVGLLKESQNA
jgi:AcrR family transcriptional regulator